VSAVDEPAAGLGWLNPSDASLLRIAASGFPMIRPMTDTRQYRIIIRGECGRLLVSLMDNVQVESSRGGDTCVVALVRDDPEFWGLLEQLRDLALHLVSVEELGHGLCQADAATGRP
jgi:hypothetical protein